MGRSPLSKQSHLARLELYNQGMTDLEITSRLNITMTAISSWRHRLQLPAHRKDGDGSPLPSYRREPPRSVKRKVGGVPMEDALSPDQCEDMRRFLSRLVALKGEYPGRKLDVGTFIKGYRDGGFV